MDREHGPEDRELEALLRRLDHEPPGIRADDVIRLAARRTAPAARIAAGIVGVLLAAGTAYALPGSPVPGWLGSVARWTGIAPGPTPVQEAPAGATDAGGVVLEANEPLRVAFGAGPGGFVRVVLTDATELVASAPPGAGRFSAEPNRLAIVPLLADTFEVRIPRSAPRVEIVVGERTVFLKAGDRVTAAARAAGDGTYLLALAPTRP